MGKIIVAVLFLLSHFGHYTLNIKHVNKRIEATKEYPKLRWVKCEYGYLIDGMQYRSVESLYPLYTAGHGIQLFGVQPETIVEVLIPLTKKEYEEIRLDKKNPRHGTKPRLTWFDYDDKRNIPVLHFEK